jgi:hypothetical protein
MAEKLLESDVLAEMDRVREAFALIRKHYPDHILTLVPATGKTASQDIAPANGAAARGVASVRSRTGTIKSRVCEACRGKWVSSREIVELTELSPKQVEGVISGKDTSELFERRRLPDADRTHQFAALQYKLKESADKPKS